GDYGTIQGVGTANNGRALIAPPWGILARDFHPTDTELFLDPSTPVANFPPLGTWTFVTASFNSGQFAWVGAMNYTGINSTNNSLTGVYQQPGSMIPAGTRIQTWCGDENKAIFVAAGANPGWTLTNLELAFTSAGTCGPCQQDA